MSVWRRRAKRDKNEGELIAVAEAMGATCLRISVEHGPDLVIGANGKTALLELKVGKKPLREGQAKFAESWQGSPVHVVRNSSEMVAVVKGLKG